MAALKALYSKHRTSFRNSISAAIHGLYDNTDENSNPSFRHLSDDEINQLTSILAHQSSPETPLTNNQQENYHTLITTQAGNISRRIQSQDGKPSTSLCQKHANLSSRALISTLHWVQNAIDTKFSALIYPLSKEHVISGTLQGRFNQLREVCGMWVGPTEYEQFFKRKVNPRWSFQSDHCPGCILARMGGEADVLITFKGGMIACTASSEISTSRRHKWINAWIDNGFDAKAAAEIFGEAIATGLKLQQAATAFEQSNQAFAEVIDDALEANAILTTTQDNRVDTPITYGARPADTVAQDEREYNQSRLYGHGNSADWDACPLQQPDNTSLTDSYNPYGWSCPDAPQQRHEVTRQEQAYTRASSAYSQNGSASHFDNGYQRDLDVDAFLKDLEEEERVEREGRRN
jgi:hypothetical protein